MRLSPSQAQAIRTAVARQDPAARVILFGSRADDHARGGDIDLLVISECLGLRDEWRIRRDILDEIGWQKLDLIVARPNALDSGIARLAIASGISL
jgi:predicted nucleotidyltransferase